PGGGGAAPLTAPRSSMASPTGDQQRRTIRQDANGGDPGNYALCAATTAHSVVGGAVVGQGAEGGEAVDDRATEVDRAGLGEVAGGDRDLRDAGAGPGDLAGPCA